MKKRMIMLAAVTAFTMALSACGTAQTGNNPTPTVGQTTEATTAPTAEPTTEATTAPTAEPTAEPTPESTATVAPQETPTPEPTATSTPTSTEALVEEIPDFDEILKELHKLITYEEREAYVASLNSSRYKVEAVDNFDLIMQANGVETDYIQTYDMETGEYIREVAPNSRMYYPFVSERTLSMCAEIDLYAEQRTEILTGEVYLMTITDLTTGETDPWGVKIHKAGAKVIEEENEWGWFSYTYIVDPDSPVTVVCCTVEELIAVKNDEMDWGTYYHEKHITSVSPLWVGERHDDDWNPTGEYYFYEYSEEVVYVAEEEIEYDEYWEQYYCYDEDGWEQYLEQDENGAYYYISRNEYEVPIEERGYTIAEHENYGLYLVDKDGNIVMQEEEYTTDGYEPAIMTWDTLKYYMDVCHPKFEQDFLSVYYSYGEYALADMKAEDYSYLEEGMFESLMEQYMKVYNITLDEEILAIRASIPEEWTWYKYYYDKTGVLEMPNSESPDVDGYTTVIINRQENWYFDGNALAVNDENVRMNDEDEPAHNVGYSASDIKAGATDAETKKAAVEDLAWYADVKEDEVHSMEVNGKQVFYAESESYDSRIRYFYMLQDIGLPYLVRINITTYDVETDMTETVKKFLLDGNYSIVQ